MVDIPRAFLQYVAVCCSALQCVAMCCSVLKCVAGALQCIGYARHVPVVCRFSRSLLNTHYILQCVAVCCSVLQCIAVCCRFVTMRWIYISCSVMASCNTLQHAATRCNTLQHAATCSNTLQHAATHQTHRKESAQSDCKENATCCNTVQHTLQYAATHQAHR